MALRSGATKMAALFEYTPDDVRAGVHEFLKQMDEGLEKSGQTLSQIPTYVTAVPNGTEKGVFLAVDLGGTNFRVCSINLLGNTTFTLTQSKVSIPKDLMVAQTAQELFAFLAKQIEAFLETHHNEHFEAHKQRKRAGTNESAASVGEEIFDLGFTFSFPVEQHGISKGTLMRWTKGFNIPDAIGKDVCALLQEEMDKLHLPVRVAALVNDTVGTLMARSYTSPGKTGTLLGAIFGTGTNGAYVEKLERIKKLRGNVDTSDFDHTTGEMVLNTEWGSFDNHLNHLPNTVYDQTLDEDSVNTGHHIFEKRISGMYLGEILRRVLADMVKSPHIQLFKAQKPGVNRDVHSATKISADSALYRTWGIDTSFLSVVTADTSSGLEITRQALEKDLGVSAASVDDAHAVRELVVAVGRRSARLSAVAIAAIVISSGRLTQRGSGPEDDGVVDIGVDGSLVEYYPGFESMLREALREVPEIGPKGEKRIRIGIAKDGSGVGAALIALVASKALKAR